MTRFRPAQFALVQIIASQMLKKVSRAGAKIMTRKIKLQPHYVTLKWRETKVVPKLTLSGKWLQTAGFLPNKTIYVKVENGRLVITAEKLDA